jgi:hypothetical protein
MSTVSAGTPDVSGGTEQLIGLLEQQRACYTELKKLAHRQRQLITDHDPEALLKILAERQRYVDQLADLNRALSPFRQEWNQTYSQMLGERRQYVQKVLDEINLLMGSILVSDAEDSRLLAANKETVRGQMTSTAVGRMANTAYAAGAYQAAGGAKAANHEA